MYFHILIFWVFLLRNAVYLRTKNTNIKKCSGRVHKVFRNVNVLNIEALSNSVIMLINQISLF